MKKAKGLPAGQLLDAESIFTNAKKLLDEKINTFSEILERMHDGFFALDKRWRVTYFNQQAERLTGKGRDEVLGKNFWKLFPTAVQTIAHPMYRHAMATGEPVAFEMFSQLYNAWYVVHAYPSTTGLSVFFKNITVRKKQEEQLKLMNHRYELVSKATSDVLWDWDIESDTGYLSEQYQKIYGIATEQPRVSEVWQHSVHPDDRDRVTLSLYAALNDPSRDQWQEEYRFYRFDKTIAHVLDRSFIVRDEAGKAIRMVGSKQDITVLREADEEIRRLSKVVKETSNAVVITDPKERITWVNKAFLDITGYEPEEVMGKRPGPLLQGPGTDRKTKAYLREQINTLQPFKCEISNYNKSGAEYWIEMKGEAIKDRAGKVESYFAIQSNITERVTLQKKLIDQQRQMQQQISKAIIETQEHERTEMGKELHDNVCQIIATAKLYLENTQQFPDQAPEFIRKGMELCTLALNEIRGIAHQLVAPKIHRQNLQQSINELLDHYRVFKNFSINFACDIEDLQPSPELSLTLYRIVQEQMNNIIKHAKADRVTVTLSSKDARLCLRVRDNGVGFDVSQKHIGLGLTNIRNRASLYGGKTVVNSQPGKGTELTVLFPWAGAAASASTHAA